MSGQMFSFCGQKAGLGKGAVPEAHPDNEPLPTQATLGPDLPRRRQGLARVAATLGLPQGWQRFFPSGALPGGEEWGRAGTHTHTHSHPPEREPGVRQWDGDTLVPPTQLAPAVSGGLAQR